MKQIILCLPLLYSMLAFGQSTRENQVKEAEEKLRDNKATISQILTDRKYDAIHPETSFRELIKKYCKAETISIATDTIPGKKIKVTGTVKNSEGNPVVDALVYLYHTDARGWYAADAPHVSMNEGDMRHARLFGYVKTDKNGMFELHTIKPSGYPKSDLPAHIHVHIDATGHRPFISELLFDDDDRLVGNIRESAIRNRFIISKPENATPPSLQQFSYTIQLSK